MFLAQLPPVRQLSWLCSLFIFLSLFVACAAQAEGSESLLNGKMPVSSRGLLRSEQLNDGRVSGVGSSWNSNITSVFSNLQAEVIYDLGAVYPLRSIALLGDNNDIYEVSASDDGKEFRSIWRAERVEGAGLQWRQAQDLAARGRFLKLSPLRGDSGLSVAELVVYQSVQESMPPVLQSVKGRDTGLYYRSMLLNLTGIVLLTILLLSSRVPWQLRVVLVTLCIYFAALVVGALMEGYPLAPLPVSLTRGLVATMALGVVLREGWISAKSWPIFRTFHVALLSILAVLSVATFYNLGKPQFFDHQKSASSIVHQYDMRVYFPAAKYFEELKYDGLYLASVASYAEEHDGLESPELNKTRLRDLRTHKMVAVPEVRDELRVIAARFSPERWREFKSDMSYFWRTMGSKGYLGSLRDHGGNATPLWLALVHLMYGNAAAGNTVLLLGGLLDPLLLVIFFICAWRTFGARAACIALIVFGANDFYMFGSNWAGATLRNDWMVYLGFGVCAMAKDRYRIGGAFLALSALIRAFPAFTLLALGLPIIFWAVRSRKEEGRWPTIASLKRQQAWFLQTAFGAAICVAVLVMASSLILGWDAWALWLQKITSFRSTPHVNHLSLLSVVAGSEANQHLVLSQRLPFYFLIKSLFVALAFWACRDLKPHQVALLGLVLMPAFLYPANYYLHSIFLLTLLVGEPMRQGSTMMRIRSARVWSILLLICMAQYLTVREKSLDVHFYNASVILCAGLVSILFVLLPRDAEGRVVLAFARRNREGQ